MIYKILFISILFWLGTPSPVSCIVPQQDQKERDKQIRKRWDFGELHSKYPYSAPEIIDTINRCFPHEIDTMVTVGSVKTEEGEWEQAMVWFDLVFKYDRDNIQAHYHYGIAKREWGRNAPPIIKGIAYGNSRRHFEKVIALDSTYSDVFFQYAMLEHFREHNFEAIELAHHHLRFHGMDHDTQKRFFRYYDYMLNHTALGEAEKWLESRRSIYDTYYLGELYRRIERFSDAESIFKKLLSDPSEIPPQQCYLSLVRLYVQMQMPETAEAQYWRAVETVTHDLEADIILEDFLSVVNEREYEILTGDSRLRTLNKALNLFWLRRNPMPFMDYNPRLIEHYRRIMFAEKEFLYDGYRHNKYKDESAREFHFPIWYDLNYKYTDMGLIYIRFGEPDEKRVVTGRAYGRRQSGPPTRTVESNMAWYYSYIEGYNQSMIFQFIVHEHAPPGFYTLVPVFFDGLAEIADLDPSIVGAWGNVGAMNDMITRRVAYVDWALENDRHTWPKDAEMLDMFHSLATFQETAEMDLLQLAYALPLESVLEDQSRLDSTFIETGVVVFDENMNPLFNEKRTITNLESGEYHVWNDLLIGEYEFPLSSAEYNISINARIPDKNRNGGHQYHYALDCSPRDRLACGSLKLAYHIEPGENSDSRSREALTIIPNPTMEFLIAEPLFVYFEIYNLSYDREGTTEYTIRFRLQEKQKNRNLLNRVAGLFGGREGYQVSVENTQTGSDRAVNDYISFDMSRLKKGDYELVLLVMDHVSGDETATKAGFILK